MPESSKGKILCEEDPGWRTGFGALEFPLGMESKFLVVLIVGCTFFSPHFSKSNSDGLGH